MESPWYILKKSDAIAFQSCLRGLLLNDKVNEVLSHSYYDDRVTLIFLLELLDLVVQRAPHLTTYH